MGGKNVEGIAPEMVIVTVECAGVGWGVGDVIGQTKMEVDEDY